VPDRRTGTVEVADDRRRDGPTAERRLTVGAAVLARDEAAFLDGCLGSLCWADRLLVLVDAATRDETAAIARRYTDAVAVRPFQGFSHQRNAALDLIEADWVLFVDADERVTPALAAEVRRALARASAAAGFWIPRRNIIRGCWVRHAGWWPDWQLRLLHRDRARYDESVLVHEVPGLDGSTGTLAEPFLHLNYESFAEFRAKQTAYARLEARALWRRGARARPHSLVLQPLREFRRRYVELGGYRQARLGLALSAMMAEATFATYRELRRLQSAAPPPDPSR
jgi:(heptosyl)LPS beta-1,4-glucosyltransferase